jgi:hypothetical protein
LLDRSGDGAADCREGTGYLLKSRVIDVAQFIETVAQIAAGGSVVDPSLVRELIRTRRRHDPLDVLSPRECEVLALMAEGASNAGIWPSSGSSKLAEDSAGDREALSACRATGRRHRCEGAVIVVNMPGSRARGGHVGAGGNPLFLVAGSRA